MNNADSEKPRWYSIKEAAEYLNIGEPTVFRWMRDGKITYRKIGDSTRFLQEDLDSVVQVFHSDRDIENAKKLCPLCHVGELVPGVFRTTGLNYFQPKKTKFWTLKDSNIETEARMCDRCGAIHLFGDTQKLNELKESQTPPAAPPADATEMKEKNAG